MAAFKTPLLRYLALLLVFFNISTAATILVRQDTTSTTGVDSTNCTNYARTANLTAVGLNSTFRAAFLRSAPMGVSFAATMLDQAALKAPALQFDSELNAQCGNLTTVALQDAATNFTQGTVLGITIEAAVGVPPDSFAMLFSWGFITLMMIVMCGSL